MPNFSSDFHKAQSYSKSCIYLFKKCYLCECFSFCSRFLWRIVLPMPCCCCYFYCHCHCCCFVVNAAIHLYPIFHLCIFVRTYIFTLKSTSKCFSKLYSINYTYEWGNVGQDGRCTVILTFSFAFTSISILFFAYQISKWKNLLTIIRFKCIKLHL